MTRTASAGDGTQLGFHVTGQGPPVVLVHGASSDARQWTALVPLLSTRWTVVAMDRRGRGASGPLRPDHSLEAEYADVAAVALAAARPPAPVWLLGHSSGARLALHGALAVPNLAGLVLYEPPAPETFGRGVLESLASLEQAQDREAILRTFLMDVAGNDAASEAFLRTRPVWPLMLENALTLPAELRAAARYRFEPSAFADLRVPTTCLVGGRSGPELHLVAARLADALPDAQVRVLPGQGHGAMFTAPWLLASELDLLLTRAAPGAP